MLQNLTGKDSSSGANATTNRVEGKVQHQVPSHPQYATAIEDTINVLVLFQETNLF